MGHFNRATNQEDKMGDRVGFHGKVVRIERDGFGVVEFDEAIGASANTHGVFSTTVSEPGLPFGRLKPGVQVTGTAEPGERDLAAVKTLEVDPAT
jgi:hypothetical protein